MQIIDIRYQLYLHRKKIVLFLFAFAFMVPQLKAQKDRRYEKTENLPNYDNRLLHYGFSIGLQSSSYRVKYSDAFLANDSLQSIMAPNSFGFSLGLIANLRIAEYLDLRFLPEVTFYENSLNYNYIRGSLSSTNQQIVEATFVEFPLLLKYKSVRRGNSRLYLVGGVEPGIEATGKKGNEEGNQLGISGTNLSLQVGFGMDVYFPLFKFAPEIRYSRGLVNSLGNQTNQFGEPIDRLVTNTVTLYLLFE